MITYTENIALFFIILGVKHFKLELPEAKVKMGSYLCTKYGVGNDLQYATQMKLIAYVVQELLIFNFFKIINL